METIIEIKEPEETLNIEKVLQKIQKSQQDIQDKLVQLNNLVTQQEKGRQKVQTVIKILISSTGPITGTILDFQCESDYIQRNFEIILDNLGYDIGDAFSNQCPEFQEGTGIYVFTAEFFWENIEEQDEWNGMKPISLVKTSNYQNLYKKLE